MIKKVNNYCRSIYDVFIYKIIKYYDPIIENLVYTQDNKLFKYNIFKSYTDVDFIYKIQNIEYYNQIYYNQGVIYHTSNIDINNLSDRELVLFEDDIDSIRIKLSSTTKDEYFIVDEKFVNSILYYTTTKSRLEPLLYYYLNRYLSNFDKIIEVEFNINNEYIKVNIKKNIFDIIEDIK